MNQPDAAANLFGELVPFHTMLAHVSICNNPSSFRKKDTIEDSSSLTLCMLTTMTASGYIYLIACGSSVLVQS